MNPSTLISIAEGDGVGPEIMSAVLKILNAAQAPLQYESVNIGLKAFDQGYASGVDPAAWESIRRTKVLLKAPVMTPEGSFAKSPNIVLRKTLGMYANIRTCIAYHPFVHSKHPGMNVVIIRENEEDLYAGMEHRQTAEVTQGTKLMSQAGCQQIVRFAFEYARTHNRKKVTCLTKDNIMKLTDGLFHKSFDAIAPEYPEIKSEHWIVDIGTAKVADTPEQFDVIVTPNLYGDILNDMTAQLAGSLGMAGSASFGPHCAMFDTVHGSVPHRQGLDQANPSGLLMAAVMMLNHLGQAPIASTIHNAWLKTLEDGFVTYDMQSENTQLLGTQAFAQKVIDRLGQKPQTLQVVDYPLEREIFVSKPYVRPQVNKELVGVDIFLNWEGHHVSDLLEQLNLLHQEQLKLELISNRGVKAWPDGFPETFCTDHWRLRFLSPTGTAQHAQIIESLEGLQNLGLEAIKTELLYNFDGQKGFS